MAKVKNVKRGVLLRDPFSIYVTADMLAWLKRHSAINGCSVNNQVNDLLDYARAAVDSGASIKAE